MSLEGPARELSVRVKSRKVQTERSVVQIRRSTMQDAAAKPEVHTKNWVFKLDYLLANPMKATSGSLSPQAHPLLSAPLSSASLWQYWKPSPHAVVHRVPRRLLWATFNDCNGHFYAKKAKSGKSSNGHSESTSDDLSRTIAA